MEDENTKRKYSNYTNRALREIIKSPDLYERWAYSAAQSELNKRYVNLFAIGGSDRVQFSDLLKIASFEDIAEELELIKEKYNIPECRLAYEKLISLQPSANSQSSDSSLMLNLYTMSNGSIALSVLDKSSGTTKYPNMLTWNAWLTLEISEENIIRYGEQYLVALSLLKITENGFWNYDSNQSFLEM